ncbi:MAG: UvrD-helicase domain-containing protein [Deltaproteobacteria bacterium]|nr:UvrD-helicase domain-containing protein [Deltaproteobacteria bacterium]
MSFLEKHSTELNSKQLEAVRTVDGPVLVLAGAGSGKTRVLTYRIAHLLFDYRVPMHSILAMTFSNKAAREMHDRVKVLLGDQSTARLPWISTFHSVCARILRAHGGRMGYGSDFVIYDESEQLSMIKTCIEKLEMGERDLDPQSIHSKIGNWKNDGKTADEVADLAVSSFDETCAIVYKTYTSQMLAAQAVDFDDLLLYAYKLFKDNPDLKLMYQEQWKYILIDEFQDTNEIQYKLLKEMINPDTNICVVGDDDQSIYGWRGAKIENILQFDQQFKKAKVIKLEQNYRSTGNILKAAASVISKNQMRHEKTLWTESGEGQKIRMATLGDDRDEAAFVVGEAKRLIKAGTRADQVAIFYRVNSLSRGFEEECLKQRLPYRIIGGFRFYERKEIKDILAYLKILLNPADVMAFRRTINTPLRGIGKTSIEKIEGFAASSGLPISQWIIAQQVAPITGKGREGFKNYRSFLEWGQQAVDSTGSFVDLIVEMLRRIKYIESLEAEPSEENTDRLENIREFMSAVQEFEENWNPPEVTGAADAAAPSSSSSETRQKLRDFLERVSLISDVDQLDDVSDQVTFMSFHAAKGLEFHVCFMTAMEEGLFPSARSLDDYSRTEEERRLCYVGVTRAREKLYLTRASRRRTFGSINFNIPSRFLKDIPPEVLETVVDESFDDDSYSYESASRFNRQKSSFGYSKAKARSAPAQQTQEWMSDFDFDQRVEEERFTYQKGDRIAHPSFGDGIVQRAERMGEDECLTIVFAGRGVKKVLAKFVTKR